MPSISYSHFSPCPLHFYVVVSFWQVVWYYQYSKWGFHDVTNPSAPVINLVLSFLVLCPHASSQLPLCITFKSKIFHWNRLKQTLVQHLLLGSSFMMFGLNTTQPPPRQTGLQPWWMSAFSIAQHPLYGYQGFPMALYPQMFDLQLSSSSSVIHLSQHTDWE